MRKSLYDISMKITEEEYRNDPALSYSILARYEREGFSGIDHIYEKAESPSLTFGSAVDNLITGGETEFEDRFMVADFPVVPDNIISIVRHVFSLYKDEYRSLLVMPDSALYAVIEEHNWQPNWKPETRIRVLREKGNEYYTLLYIAGERTILDTVTYQDVLRAVKALKESDATWYYFAKDNPFDNIERYYQLKFKAALKGIEYKCMFDLCIVDHESKTIQPVDLKTSCRKNDREYDFPKHYVEYNYDIQNRLYVRILEKNLTSDPYFYDFRILPYKDIIIFRGSDSPLVWDIPFTFDYGTLYFGKNRQIEMRDPEEIGKELSYYLAARPNVPSGISETESNDISKWLERL